MTSNLKEPKQNFVHMPPQEDKMQRKPNMSQGVILKRAREERGFSIETIHEETKIPMDALRAIEEGYTIRTLASFYRNGFVKIYAQYLGVEVADVIEDYKTEKLPKYVKKEVEEFEIPLWITDVLKRITKKHLMIFAGVVVGLFLLFKIVNFFANRPASSVVRSQKAVIPIPQKIKKQEVVKVVKKKEPVVTKKEEPAQPQPQPAQQNPAAVTAAPVTEVIKNVMLTVRAQESSWLRVKTDDVVVFQSTLRLGAVETWMADEKIEISGKHINQLEFELNGKMIGTLGRKERRVKKVIVTKDGLSVSR